MLYFTSFLPDIDLTLTFAFVFAFAFVFFSHHLLRESTAAVEEITRELGAQVAAAERALAAKETELINLDNKYKDLTAASKTVFNRMYLKLLYNAAAHKRYAGELVKSKRRQVHNTHRYINTKPDRHAIYFYFSLVFYSSRFLHSSPVYHFLPRHTGGRRGAAGPHGRHDNRAGE